MNYVKGRCLEIGCGSGRIMRYLQDQGVDICGLDIDTYCVQLCRQLGIRDVYVESWKNMEKLGIFDTILLLNRSIGMGGTISGIKSILEKCHSCSSQEGILIFDSREIKTGLTNKESGVLERKLRFKYNNEYSEEFPWIHFSSNIAEKILNDTGWSLSKIIRVNDNYCILSNRL